MKLSEQIKPVSYLKANTAELLRQLQKSQEPMIITQNGEARAVIQDIRSFETMQENLALLKLLALGKRQVENNETIPADDVLAEIDQILSSKH